MPRRLINATARRLAHGVARGVDLAVASTALSPGAMTRKGSSAESLGHEARMQGLGVLGSFYNQEHHVDPDGAFFVRPAPISPVVRRARRFGKGGEVLDLRWPSTFEPLWSLDGAIGAVANGELPQGSVDTVADDLDRIGLDRTGTLRDKYLSVEPNMVGHARWFHHKGEVRPCVVMLHGYLGGNYLLEERMWPVRRLFDGGFDVVLSVLPFHGARRDPRRGLLPPSFPSSDPRFTIEGMRHLVHDHRALFDFLRDGQVSSIGLMGMSLGGYSSALLATLEQDLEFAVLLIPLAAIDRFAHDHGRMVGAPEEQAMQAAALAATHAVVSPLSRPPRLPDARTIVIAGEADRVTGLEHSRMLADHFGTEMVTFNGGHILQVGRGQAFEPVWAMLEGAGLYQPRAIRGRG